MHRLDTWILLILSTAELAHGQSLKFAPIPADPHELVTAGQFPAHAAELTPVLALLTRARGALNLHTSNAPPYRLTVEFTSSNGAGKFIETRMSQHHWRWTASLGDFSLTRVADEPGMFDDHADAALPLRLHMLYTSIFWNEGHFLATQFRTASIFWNGHPATCVLLAEQPSTDPSTSRRWDEEELCIDDESGLLQMLSPAPGSYILYGYAQRATFRGRPVPDRIQAYLAGSLVLDALLRFDDPGDAGAASLTPTEQMLRNGDAADLSMPRWMEVWESLDTPSTIAMPVVVHAKVDAAGRVISQEVCATSDPSLNERALDRAKWAFGAWEAQREYYLQVRFVPPHTLPVPTVAEARIPLVAYYLERTVTTDRESSFHRQEVLARRADGSTVQIGRDPEHGLHVRALEFPDGTSLDVYDSIGVKVTYPKQRISPAAQKATALEGPKDCAAHVHAPLLRRDTLEGEEVEVTQQISGESRATTWYAPRLGCAVLQADYEKVQPDGSYHLAAQTKTTKLIVGEPDSHPFEIASDLEEAKPWEAEFRFWESRNPNATAGKKAEKRREFERLRADDDRFYARK